MAVPSFTITGPNATLRPAIDAVGRVVEESVVDVGDGGLATRAVDPANAATVDVDIPPAALDTLDVAADGRFGVDISALSNALNDINKDERVTLRGSREAAAVEVVHAERGATVATVDMDDPSDLRTPPDPLDVTWTTTAEMNGDQFSRIIRVSDEVTDTIAMGVAPAGGDGGGDGGGGGGGGEMVFQTRAEGDIDQVIGYPRHSFEQGGPPAETMAALYPMDYLDDFRLGVDRPKTAPVRLSFADSDFPLRMAFAVGANGAGAGVEYTLAPRNVADAGAADAALREHAVDSLALENPAFVADADGGRGKELFKSLDAFVSEYAVLATPEGLESRVVDPSNVGLRFVEVHPDYFDSYTELAGFPDAQFGLGSGRVMSALSKWRKNDDFEFAYSHARRRIALKHDIFTVHQATIDPGGIRKAPDLPEFTLSGEASDVDEGALRDATIVADSLADHGLHYMSDGRYYLGAEGELDLADARAASGVTVTEDVPADAAGDTTVDVSFRRELANADVRGTALSLVSLDYQDQLTLALPTGSNARLIVRAGKEFPVVFRSNVDGDELLMVSVVAPRITTEDGLEPMARRVLADEPVDLGWLSEPVSGDITPFEGIERESVKERLRRQRLSEFPIDSRIQYVTTFDPDDAGGDAGERAVGTVEERDRRGKPVERGAVLRVAEAEDMAVPEETFGEVLATVEDELALAVLDSGEAVADVTFTAASAFDIEYRNIQPDSEYALTTDDGFRMRDTVSEDDNYVYASERTETPALTQVRVAARADPDADSFGVYAYMHGRDDLDATAVDTGHRTIGNAYAALESRIAESTLEGLVRDAGGAVTPSDRDVRQELSDVADKYAGYSLHLKPGSAAPDSEFYAGLKGARTILPDAQFDTRISINKPDRPGGDYPIHYTVTVVAHGPGNARREVKVASEDMPAAEGRAEIADRVRSVFSRLSEIDPVLAETDRPPRPPRHPAELPPPREGDIAEWVAAYLPAPKSSLEPKLQNRGLPVELTDVDRVGPARAETLEAVGVEDMLDYVALSGTEKDILFLGQATLELSRRARDNLQDAAEDIWESIIWPAREHSLLQAEAPSAPPAGMPAEVEADVVVNRVAGDLNYTVSGDPPAVVESEAVSRALDALGDPERYGAGQDVGDIRYRGEQVLSFNPIEPEPEVTVVSPNRPLTRGARDALEPFTILEERSVREAGRQTEVDLLERPPSDVLEKHELFVDEPPIEVWETDRGDRIEIFRDAVIAGGEEMGLSPEEAAERVREEERFTPLEVPEDSPFGPVQEGPESEEPPTGMDEGVIEIPITVAETTAGLEYRVPTGEVSMAVDEEVNDIVESEIGPASRRTADERVGTAFVSDEDVATRRELLRVEVKDRFERPTEAAAAELAEEAAAEPEEPDAPPEPPEPEEPDEGTRPIEVAVATGRLNYTVPAVPPEVEAGALSAALEVLGKPGQFDAGDQVGEVRYRGTDIESLSFDRGRELLAEMEDGPEAPAEPETEPELTADDVLSDFPEVDRDEAAALAAEFDTADALLDATPVSVLALPDVFGTTVTAIVDDDTFDPNATLRKQIPDKTPEPTSEPTPGERSPEELRDDQIEAIIERATLGVDATALTLGDVLQEIRMSPQPGAPVGFDTDAEVITTLRVDGVEGTINEALDKWESFVDPDTLSEDERAEVNRARAAISESEQFPVTLPQLSPEPEAAPAMDPAMQQATADGFTEAELEEIIIRSTEGAAVDVSIQEDIDNIRIDFDTDIGTPQQFVEDIPTLTGVASNPVALVNEAIAEWEVAVDLRTVDIEGMVDERARVEEEFGIDLMEVGEPPPEREELAETVDEIEAGVPEDVLDDIIQRWQDMQREEIAETKGIAAEDVPEFDIPVEFDEERRAIAEQLAQQEVEAKQEMLPDEMAGQVDVEDEGLTTIDDGLQVHHTEAVHDQVHAAIARQLDAEPANFYDSSEPSDKPGYDLVYSFYLRRDDPDEPFTNPRFVPSQLLANLEPIDGAEILIETVGFPLA